MEVQRSIALNAGMPQGDWQPVATIQGINNVTDCKLDARGNLYVSDLKGNQVYKLNGGFLVLLVVASAALIELDRDGILGVAIGGGLRLVNLAARYLVPRRALRKGMKLAMRTLLAGFFARLLTVAGLTLAFQRSEGVDAVAFALTFLVFFFVYLGVEVMLVERTLPRAGRPA